jgi:LysM repeat protein
MLWTVTVSEDAPAESGHAAHPLPGTPPVPETSGQTAHHEPADIREICPYLTSSSGAWRSAAPHREHRCRAVDPPGHLTHEKQRRLCLSVEHGSCPAFWAARANRAAVLAPGADPSVVAAADASRRPIARSTPLVLEHHRLPAAQARWPLDRAMSQVALVVLMILAFGAVAVARLSSPASSLSAIPTPSASSAASPTATPRRTVPPSPSSGPSSSAPSGSPVASASAGAVQGIRTTYRVKKGDTLSGIAATYQTTVAAIRQLNNLPNSDLKIGQVLKIP